MLVRPVDEATRVSRTLARGTAAPCGSNTVPAIELVCWALDAPDAIMISSDRADNFVNQVTVLRC